MENEQFNSLPNELKIALAEDREEHLECKYQSSFDWSCIDRQTTRIRSYRSLKIALAACVLLTIFATVVLLDVGRKISQRRCSALTRINLTMVSPGSMSISVPGSFPMSVSGAMSKINLYNASTGVSVTTTGLRPRKK